MGFIIWFKERPQSRISASPLSCAPLQLTSDPTRLLVRNIWQQPGRPKEKQGQPAADRGFACCIPVGTATEISELLKELTTTGSHSQPMQIAADTLGWSLPAQGFLLP